MGVINKFIQVLGKHYGEEEYFYGFGETEKGYVSKASYEDILTEMGLKFVEDISQTDYDSYGNTSIDHKIIFFHSETDTYYALTGQYESYSGTEWDGFRKVSKKEKTIEVWE